MSSFTESELKGGTLPHKALKNGERPQTVTGTRRYRRPIEGLSNTRQLVALGW